MPKLKIRKYVYAFKAIAAVLLLVVMVRPQAQTAKFLNAYGRLEHFSRSAISGLDQIVEPDVFNRKAKEIAPKFALPNTTKKDCTAALVQIRLRGGLENLVAGDALISTFDQECLGGVGMLPNELKAAGIESVIGVVEVAGNVRCTSFRIRKDVAMTARHCFYSRENSEPEFGEPPSGVTMSLLADDATRYNAKVISCVEGLSDSRACKNTNGGPIQAMNDFVYLKLDGPPRLEMPELSILNGLPQGPLFLMGYWGYAPGYSAREKMRWTRNALCYAPVVVKQCMYHSCQAINGFSGGGIFSMSTSGGTLQLAGIHLAGVGSGYADCPDEVTANVGNVGVILHAAQIQVKTE